MLINIEWFKISNAFEQGVWGLEEMSFKEKEEVLGQWNGVRAAIKEYHEQLEQKIVDLLSQHMALYHEPKLKCPYCGARKE